MNKQSSELLNLMWCSAIEAVSGEYSVRRCITEDSSFEPDLIVAVGKAAASMTVGAYKALKSRPQAIVVTKYGHLDANLKSMEDVTVYETAHPIPDAQSLIAGEELITAIEKLSDNTKLLLLVSGGASSLAESLTDDLSLAELQSTTDELISSGATINEINVRRKSLSKIKDGKLLDYFSGEEVRVYAISDVEGDDISTIGSGIGDCKRTNAKSLTRTVASNSIARQAVTNKAIELECEVIENSESLYDDVFTLAENIGKKIVATAIQDHSQDDHVKILVWGGEPTIRLPDKPGNGGRNQSLALAISEKIQGLPNVSVLIAGTDGTDGPTDAAGGIVDGDTWQDSAREYLDAADAGSYLRQNDAIFITGPTNTNVMDLVIAVIS